MKQERICQTKIFNIISKKWAICIINALGDGKLRYNELKNALNCSSKTLSDLLKELEKENLIRRIVYPKMPIRVEYSLTEDGKKLRESLLPLFNWIEERS